MPEWHVWDHKIGNVLFQWPMEKKGLNPLNCRKPTPNFIKDCFWWKDTKKLNGNKSRNPGPDSQNTFMCLKSTQSWKLWGFMFNCEGALPGKDQNGYFGVSFSVYNRNLYLDSCSLEHLVHAQQETQACMESLWHLLVSPSFANLWRSSTSAWGQLFWACSVQSRPFW